MDPTAAAPRLLTATEVAELLGLTPRTVKRLAAEGRLARVVLGRRSTRYRQDDVARLIDDCTQNDLEPAANGPETETKGGHAHARHRPG